MDNPQSSPPGPYGPMYPQTATPTSGWAVAALVLGIVSVLGGFCLLAIPCIGAVVCGHVGLADTRPGTNGGRSMAIAGLIMGYLGLLLALLLLLIGGVVLPDLPSTF